MFDIEDEQDMYTIACLRISVKFANLFKELSAAQVASSPCLSMVGWEDDDHSAVTAWANGIKDGVPLRIQEYKEMLLAHKGVEQ